MISVDEAIEILKSTERSFGSEMITLEKSIGRILNQQLIASSDLPPFNRVMMDGIAVRADEVTIGQMFRVKGLVGAGESYNLDQEFVEIMTGAALPEHFDTVIPYEHVSMDNDTFIINEPFKKGQNVHLKGTDAKKGDCLVASSLIIGPAEIAIAASMGYAQLEVLKKPTCSIFNTGNELVAIDQATNPFQIRASNGIAIASALQDWLELVHQEIIGDDIRTLEKSISKALEASDVIIITGGVSAGKMDHIPSILGTLGVEILFHKVAQKPGKPILFGVKDKKVVFALPGNPVSSLMCTHSYVLPWIKKNSGIPQSFEFPLIELNTESSKKGSLTFFMPVIVRLENAKLLAYPVKNNGSGDFSGLHSADGWLLIPASLNAIPKGFVGKFIPMKTLF